MSEEYSFIDLGNKDFLRDDDGEVIIIEGTFHEAEEWLLEHGEKYGWTNSKTRFWSWDAMDEQRT